MKIVDKKTKKRTKLHVLTCPICEVIFGAFRNTRKYCSIECKKKGIGGNLKKGKLQKCIHCLKEFWVKPSENRRGSLRQFCSRSCRFPNKKLNLPVGEYLSYDGYIVVSRTKCGRNQVKKHRLIMEEHLDRKLLPTEIVHHKNENKLDNRLCNLQLVSRSEHNRIHRLLERRIA